MMRLWRNLGRKRAARLYARLLQPQLHRDYGAGDGYYTAEQIAKAAAKLGLSRRHLAVAYAAFMRVEDFRRLPQLSGEDYQGLRELFGRFVVRDMSWAASGSIPPSYYAE